VLSFHRLLNAPTRCYSPFTFLGRKMVQAAAMIYRKRGRYFLLEQSRLRFVKALHSIHADDAAVDDASGAAAPSRMLIDDGKRLVEALDVAPLDTDPRMFGAWIEDELIPSMAPQSVRILSAWAVARTMALQKAHPQKHPAWALVFAAHVEHGCRRAFGALAMVRQDFHCWQGAALQHSSSAKASPGPSMLSLKRSGGDSAHRGPATPCRRSPTSVDGCATPDSDLHFEVAPWPIANDMAAILQRLRELVRLWDEHKLSLDIKEYATMPPKDVIFRLLDRSGAIIGSDSVDHCIPDYSDIASRVKAHMLAHVLPFAQMRRLDLDQLLLEYVDSMAEAMARKPPSNKVCLYLRENRREPNAGWKATSDCFPAAMKPTADPNSAEGRTSATIASKYDHIQLSERGVAVMRFIGVSLATNNALKKQGTPPCERARAAALSLLRAAVPPLSPSMGALAEAIADGSANRAKYSASSERGEPAKEATRVSFGNWVTTTELVEAARLLRIQVIVAHYRVTNFNAMNPVHARRLVEFLIAIHERGMVREQEQDAATKENGFDVGLTINARDGHWKSLDDAVHICDAYSHLSVVRLITRYVFNMLELRVPSKQEVRRLLGALSRSEALLVTDGVLHYCLGDPRSANSIAYKGRYRRSHKFTVGAFLLRRIECQRKILAATVFTAYWTSESDSTLDDDDGNGDYSTETREQQWFQARVANEALPSNLSSVQGVLARHCHASLSSREGTLRPTSIEMHGRILRKRSTCSFAHLPSSACRPYLTTYSSDDICGECLFERDHAWAFLVAGHRFLSKHQSEDGLRANIAITTRKVLASAPYYPLGKRCGAGLATSFQWGGLMCNGSTSTLCFLKELCRLQRLETKFDILLSLAVSDALSPCFCRNHLRSRMPRFMQSRGVSHTLLICVPFLVVS
jgi:hypothetical protein